MYVKLLNLKFIILRQKIQLFYSTLIFTSVPTRKKYIINNEECMLSGQLMLQNLKNTSLHLLIII